MLLNKYVRYTRLSLVLSFRPMAPHIVTSGGDGHTTSPVLSSTPSFVSARSILSDLPERSPGVQDTFHVAESHQIQGVRSLVIELSGGRKPTSTYGEGSTSFIRHHKYFFPDGNTTFLVRRLYHDDGVYRLLIVQAVRRLRAHSTVSIDTFSLVTQHTSLPNFPSSTSTTMKYLIPSCHWATLNERTLTPFSLSYIPSTVGDPLFMNLLTKAYPPQKFWGDRPLLRRVEIRASPLNTLGLRFDSQAGIGDYKASDATQPAPTCAHAFR